MFESSMKTLFWSLPNQSQCNSNINLIRYCYVTFYTLMQNYIGVCVVIEIVVSANGK